MKTKIEVTEATLPEHWACYLINGDASGMGDEEQAECDAYCDRIAAEGWHVSSCGEESYFSHSNDAGTLAGSVLDYTLLRPIPANGKRSLESTAWRLLETAGIGLGDRVRVIAYELTHDGEGWSVNSPFSIGGETSGLSALEVLRGRWEVFKLNYHKRARVADLSDVSDENGVAELEVDCLPFARVEMVERGEA